MQKIPAILLMLVFLLFIFAVTEAVIYFATGKKPRIIALCKK